MMSGREHFSQVTPLLAPPQLISRQPLSSAFSYSSDLHRKLTNFFKMGVHDDGVVTQEPWAQQVRAPVSTAATPNPTAKVPEREQICHHCCVDG